ncbi:hypothetical protein V8G54_025975, partial [Vigna mungo]
VYICRKQIYKLSNIHRICKFSSSLYESFQKGKCHPQTTETQVRHYNPASEYERTHFAPRLIKGSHLLLVLFQIVTSTPALRRLWAIGEPMIPMPRKPTRDGGSVIA